MSDEEIVFGDVRFREPERRRRPDRDRKWVCLAYELPGPGDLPIFLDRRPADAIERHALRDTSVELGGILLGKECVDDRTGEPFVWIAKSLEAKHYENTQASFTYTHDSWQEITRERDRLHPDLDIVGWYHTHPDFGIFLSSHDLFIHRHFFAQPLQVAYVLDPIRQTRGFFRWREGRLDQVGGFYLTADRSDRVALARQVNDLENIPNTEGGGGILSPHLEAELIAMLTRPAPHHVTTVDRIQTTALFGLIGALVGALGVAGVLWLHHLGNRVQEQSIALQELGKNVERSSAAQRLALDTLLDQASGGQPDKFVEKYDKTVRALDESRRSLNNQKTINDTLGARL
ncbi:MAG: Mov34/MPN/PAD-1 family protein, partial [Planctomycetaceae bacterium]